MDIQDDELYKKALREKKQKKKPRETKYFPTLGLKTRRSKKPQSEIQRISNKVYGKNLQTVEEIKVFIGSEFKKFDELTTNFLHTIAEAKVINGKINFSDSLANHPITYRVKVKGGDRKWISNDYLYLASIYRIGLPSNIGSLVLDGNTKIKSVTLISAPFLYEGDTTRGFIQDNNEDFFCFGVDKLPIKDQESARNILTDFNKDVYNFTYLNKPYVAKTADICMLIINANDIANASNYMANQTVFDILSMKKRELKEKTLEIKNKPRFFSAKLVPDRFCPAYVYLNKFVEFNFLYEFEFDYNDLFQSIIKTVISKKTVDLPKDFIYWDNISNVMDLFSVLAVVGPVFNLPKEQALYFGSICDKYADIEFPIQVWHKKMLEIQKLAAEFFNSFNTKLNYDKIVDIRGKILKLNDDYKKMVADPSYEDIKEFFNLNNYLGPFNVCCKNQINSGKFQAFLDNFFGVLTKIEILDSKGLVDEIEKLGNAIYFASYSDDTAPDERFFPILLSPGAFYGDSISLDPANRKKYFTEIVTKFMVKAEEMKDRAAVKGENYLNILKNLITYRDKILWNNADQFINSKNDELVNGGLNQDEIVKAKNKLYKRLVNLANSKPTLNNEIYQVILNNANNLDKLASLALPEDMLFNYTKNAIQRILDEKRGVKWKGKGKKKKRILTMKKRIKGSDIEKADKLSGGKYGSALQTILQSTTPNDVLNNQFKSGSTTFNIQGGPYKDRPVEPVSQYLTEIIEKSGIYADEYFPDMKEEMIRENPYNIMINYPIAPKLMTHVAKKIGLPPVQDAIQNNGVDPNKLSQINEEDQNNLRQLNGIYMIKYPYSDPKNITAIKTVAIPDMEITPEDSKQIEEFYENQFEKLQESDFGPFVDSEQATKMSMLGDSNADINLNAI